MAEWFDPQISIAIDMIRYSNNVIAFTGAGISTESGIDDFRSPNGLWSKFDPNIYANYEVFLKDPKYFWELVRKIGPIFKNAKPNKAHKALVKLEKKKN